MHEQNNLSLDNLSGEGVFQSYLQCVAECFEYRNEIKIEFRKNKAKKKMSIIKLYTGLALKRLKWFSNIKPFQAFSFTFTALNGIWWQLGTV